MVEWNGAVLLDHQRPSFVFVLYVGVKWMTDSELNSGMCSMG